MKLLNTQIIVSFFIVLLLIFISCSDSSTDATPEPDPEPEPQSTPEFVIEISVADRVGKVDLIFGLEDSDDISNDQAPPPPPEGALHAYFGSSDMAWISDVRSSSDEEYEWTLNYKKGQFEPLLLSWEIVYQKNAEGNIYFKVDNSSDEIDMKAYNSIEFIPQQDGSVNFNYHTLE